MGAVSRDLVIEQGTTWTTAWAIQLDGAGLVDTAGWQARSQVRHYVQATVLWEFTTAIIGSVVQLSVSPDESSAWLWRRGVYDVEIFDTSTPPRVVRVAEGFVLVNSEVTR